MTNLDQRSLLSSVMELNDILSDLQTETARLDALAHQYAQVQ